MRSWLALALVLPTPLAAQTDLPPPEQVKEALERAPSVGAADARIEAARGSAEALRVGPHEVMLQGTISRRRAVLEDRDFQEFDGTVSRAIRLPGKAPLDRKAGALGVEVANNRAEDARHQAALSLAELWYRWLGASARQRTAAATLVNLETAARAVDRRVALRDAAILDADQARAAVATAALRAGEAVAARDRARAELAAPFPDLPLPPKAPEIVVNELPDSTLEILAEQAIERSHDITAAKRESERQSILARRAKLDRIPDPLLGFRAFQERGGQEKGLGVYVSVPFGGGYRKALADQAAGEARAAVAEVAAVRREVEAHSAGDLAETRARLSAWRSAREAVTRAEAAAAKAVRGQQAGAIDLAD
uniref:TolC family protein n=1 Tax=Sphingomonas sp. TaxID=28214 RepID=UPI003B3A2EA4